MELSDAQNVEQLLGVTDAPTEPCADCVQNRERLIAWGVVLGLGLGLTVGAIFFRSRNG